MISGLPRAVAYPASKAAFHGVDLAALVIPPELVLFGAQDVRTYVVTGRVVGDGSEKRHGQPGVGNASRDLVTPIRMDLPCEIDADLHLALRAREMDDRPNL